MNWEIIEGNWDQLKGKFLEKWGKLTDSDLDVVKGKKDQFLGLLQERYGYQKDAALQDIDDVMADFKPSKKTPN